MLVLLELLLVFATPSCEAGIWTNVKTWIFGASKPPEPSIKVLIVNDRPTASLELTGKYKIFDPRENSWISTRFVGKRKHLEATPSGIKWGEEFPGIYQIKIVPDHEETRAFINGNEYKGTFFIYAVEGNINVVNDTPVETLLSGILVPEFREKTIPEEALAAAVIAARTNAYFQEQHPRSPYWSIDAEQVGYKGIPVDARSTAERVIRKTRAMYLARKAGPQGELNPFPAQWEGGNTRVIASKIPFSQVEKLAEQGIDAAQILNQSFPGSTLELMQN